MFQKVIYFVKYNNAFTIGVMALFLGTGISFAASPNLRDSVYSISEIVTSVDNRQIVSVDLDNFNFNLRINSVTEDTKSYYIAYTYQTLAIQNSIWAKVSLEKILTVSKESLAGKDLGLYVAQQLGDNINSELAYLKRVQDLEKGKGVSQKVITVQYAGLIGKLLDTKEEVIEGYNPVIPEPTPEVMLVSEPAISPDPALFIENYPQAPVQTTQSPIPQISQKQLDEETIIRIVEQMLSQYQQQMTPTPEPTPELAPSELPTPESIPTPRSSPEATADTAVPEMTPSPVPSETPIPEITPEATPTPQVFDTPTPTPEITPESTPGPTPY